MATITIFHVEGIALHRSGPIRIDLPVEANDEAGALEQAARILKRARMAPLGVSAHRCEPFERELDRWVREVLDKVKAERTGRDRE